MRHERFLQRAQLAVLHEPLDRLYRAAVHPHGKLAARVDWPAVHEDGARAALAAVAADLGAGQPSVITQGLGERPAILHLEAALRAVERDSDRRARRRWRAGGRLRAQGRRGRRHGEHRAGALEELTTRHLSFGHEPRLHDAARVTQVRLQNGSRSFLQHLAKTPFGEYPLPGGNGQMRAARDFGHHVVILRLARFFHKHGLVRFQRLDQQLGGR